MMVLRFLLFPFAILYNLVTRIRNTLYDLGLKPSARFDVPVIGIGNLVAGGAGKTPVVEHLVRLLNEHYRVATLSRGYGRKTKGFRMGSPEENASTLGDEPFQLYQKFNQKAVIAVGEERALAIPNILDQYPETDVFIMDDSYQHRQVKPLLNILVTDYNNPFYKDFLLPAGRLRESRTGAHRADAVVVTKCPTEISDERMMEVEKAIRKYCNKPVFFAKIHYGSPVPLQNAAANIDKKVILVSGIANHEPFEAYARRNFSVTSFFRFADHHAYTQKDVEKIVDSAKGDLAVSILTTEKDAVKLNADAFASYRSKVSFFYLPIEIEFIKSGKDFDELVLNAIKGAG